MRTSMVAAVLLLSSLGFAFSARAESNASSPSVSKGKLELEYEITDSIDSDPKKAGASHEFEVKYGLTDRLRPQIEFEFEDARGEAATLDTLSVGAQYQLTKKDEAWLESAVRFNYDHRPDAAEKLRARLLLQKQYGKHRQRVNLRADQEVGADAKAGGPDWRMLVSSRYAVLPWLEAGLELDSDFGQRRDFDTFDAQKHYVGPAFYGEITDNLEFEAAYAVGISEAASNGAARLELEYVMNF
jgi:hypothetical protein